ncbi:MAG: FliM/FliN family flagellar motor switch protein [Planctomycetes bacterium]|nr:FliM/FliN family flagellar motor switch protein [Planctomycetota bacterium]
MGEEKILSQKEIDELLKTLGEQDVKPAEVKDKKKVVSYDFKKPHKLTHQQLAALKNVFESTSKFIRANFQSFLKIMVECKLVAVEQLNYEEFLKSLPVPTCLYVLDVEGFHVSTIVEFSTGSVFPMIERILGSSKEVADLVERPLTDIEWDVADRVLDRLMQTMTESTKAGYFAKYNISSREANPRFISILTATEPVISVSYEFITAKSKGLISIAIPLEIVYRLLSQVSGSSTPFTSKTRQVTTKIFENTYFNLNCYIGEYPMTVKDLIAIKSGTVLRLENGTKNSVTVSVQGKRKFKGQLGEVGKGQKAVKIMGKLLDAKDKDFVKIENSDEKEVSDIANGVEFSLSVEIANKQIEFKEISTLSEGDVIRFEKNVDAELKAYVNGKHKAMGHAVRMGDKFGFQFTTFL